VGLGWGSGKRQPGGGVLHHPDLPSETKDPNLQSTTPRKPRESEWAELAQLAHR
jgi:hypothetical protein